MRRSLYLVTIAIVAFAIWQTQSGGLSPLFSPGGPGGAGSPDTAPPGTGEAAELRIEIVETAAEAEARHRQILEQYGDDAAAQAWVADCVARLGAGQDQNQFDRSREYACWRSWADQQVQ